MTAIYKASKPVVFVKYAFPRKDTKVNAGSLWELECKEEKDFTVYINLKNIDTGERLRLYEFDVDSNFVLVLHNGGSGQ